MKIIRQGDVLFVPVDALSEELKHKVRKSGIIQHGKVTGHAHKLADLEAAEVLEVENLGVGENLFGIFVRVGPNGVSIVHEEHRTVTLDPNTTYRARIAREYDYFEESIRQVID